MLVSLVILGYRQARTRSVCPATFVVVATGMFAFSFYGFAAAFGLEPLSLLVWFAGYAVAAIGGARILSSAGMAVVGSRVKIRGSWAPMGLLLGIFAAKFILGFATGVHSVVRDSAFIVAMSAVLGMFSGGLGARAAIVHRFASGANA